jgi:hypothetical protein
MNKQENIRKIQQEADDLWTQGALLVPEFNIDYNKPQQEDFDTSRLVDEDRAAAGLRDFLKRPDKASLKQLQGTPGLEQLTQELDAQDVRGLCTAWIERHPQIEREGRRGEHNIEKIVERVRANHSGPDNDGVWTNETLDEAYRELVAEGELYPTEGYSRPLSEADKLKVARLAGQGKLGEAAIAYCEASLPHWRGLSGIDITCMPQYAGLVNDCCWFVFKHAPGYEDFKGTPQEIAFLEGYIAGRPITISLLAAGWKAYQREKREGRMTAMLPSEQPINFDSMSNEELENAMRAMNRHMNGKR